jgi:hypothetical protein
VTNSSCNVQAKKIDGYYPDHSDGIVPTSAYQKQAYKVPQQYHLVVWINKDTIVKNLNKK